MPPFDWQKAMARLDEIYVYQTSSQTVGTMRTHHAFAFLHINLVANDNLRWSVAALLLHCTCPPTNGKLSGSMGLA